MISLPMGMSVQQPQVVTTGWNQPPPVYQTFQSEVTREVTDTIWEPMEIEHQVEIQAMIPQVSFSLYLPMHLLLPVQRLRGVLHYQRMRKDPLYQQGPSSVVSIQQVSCALIFLAQTRLDARC